MGFFKKIVNSYIDRVRRKFEKKDPSINRLKKQVVEKQNELEAMLIDRFGSLDKVPKSYKKFYNIKD